MIDFLIKFNSDLWGRWMIHFNKSIQDSSACGYNGEMNLTQKYVFSGLMKSMKIHVSYLHY